ncbi:MAG: hypothetical protein HRT70_07220 [Flavobacteriaceae bacterium]|nr:hypothetical protein [Flavobacteriaceae bacterium]
MNVTLLIGVIYRPPNYNYEDNELLYELLQKAGQVKTTFKLIVGDFNFPNIDWVNFSYNPCCDQFMEATLDLNLTQHVFQPTRENSILDLVFSSHPEIVSNVDIIEPIATSDHNMVLCELNLVDETPVPKVEKVYNYRKADWNSFICLLMQVNWDLIFQCEKVDDIWLNFTSYLKNIIDAVVPLKAPVRKCNPLWITEAVNLARVKRNCAEREYLAHRTNAKRKLRNAAGKHLKRELKNAIKNFEKKLSENCDVKPFWHYVQSKRKVRASIGPLTKQDGSLTDNSQDCANTLSDFYSTVFTTENLQTIPSAAPKTNDEFSNIEFTQELVARNLASTNSFSSPGPDNIPYCVLKAGSPILVPQLCRLFQFFFDNNVVPSQWKIAHVTPIFKKGNRKDPANYRPISLTCCTCKLMESCVRELIWQFWSTKNLISPTQFGFTPRSSCASQLLKFLDDITTSVDNGDCVDVIYLDFSKAFNSVPHERLLRKLSALGIQGKVLNWVRNFLTERSEIVIVEGVKSVQKGMISGVPQGSCLGPLLFLAYVNDIDNCLAHSAVLKYADDIKLYKNFSKTLNGAATDSLQNDLDALTTWSIDWQMKFNVSKCSSLHFGHGNSLRQYEIDNQPIPISTKEKDLGIVITSNAKVSTHISHIVRRAEMCLGALKRNIVSRDKNTFLKLYKQLVRPHLEYAVAVWNPYLLRDIELVERVQRRATRCVHGLYNKSYLDRLKCVEIDSLQTRRYMFDLIEVYKIVKHLSPLRCEQFFDIETSQRTRGHPLKLRKKQCHLECRKNFFVNRVINIWNRLPENIVMTESVCQFKHHLLQFLQKTEVAYF